MNDDFDPWARGAQNIASMMMQLPAMRMQVMDARNRGAYYNANAQESLARAGNLDAETQALAEKGRKYTEFEEVAPAGLAAISQGRADAPEAQKLIGLASVISGQSPQSLMENLARMQGMVESGASGTDDTRKWSFLFGKGLPEGQSLNETQRRQSNPLILNPGQRAFNIGSNAPVAEGAPGKQWGSVTPGSFVVDNQGNVIERVPSTANPPPQRLPIDLQKLIDEEAKYYGKMLESGTATPAELQAQAAKIRNLAQSPAGAPTNAPLDRATAAAILQEAGGDKAKAREIARQRGYTF